MSAPDVRRALIAQAHRQPAPQSTITPGERSWWETHATRDGFTAAGAAATVHSRHSRAALGIGLTPPKESL